MDAEGAEKSHSQGGMRREPDSLDDFEHLGHHDTSPAAGVRTTGEEDLLFCGVSAVGGEVQQPPLLEIGDHHKQDLLVDFKSATLDFVERERNPVMMTSQQIKPDLLERFSDSEPEEEPFQAASKPTETFKDVEEFIETQPKVTPAAPGFTSRGETDVLIHAQPLKMEEIPTRNQEEFLPSKDIRKVEETAVREAPKVEIPKKIEPVIESKKLDEIQDFFRDAGRVEDVKMGGDDRKIGDADIGIAKQEPAVVVCPKKEVVGEKKASCIDAEAIFCKMGLDTWFNPERLDPKVESLIYWRDPKKSGPVFGGVLLVLLALTYFSLISVVAYLSLLALTGTLSYRIYKNIVQAVQKTGDGHPFKDLLELDVALPQDKVKEVIEIAVAHINAAVVEIRRLFLVEDLVDSIKFAVLLWTLTYLGAWFNGMTLIIIAWVALFSLPKVYETNKTQIDANLEVVRTKLADITSKVKAAIPIGKKAEEKKEQ